jgi:hypothetical protein
MKIFLASLLGLIAMWLLIGLPAWVIFELLGMDKDLYWFLCFVGAVVYLFYVNGKEEEK